VFKVLSLLVLVSLFADISYAFDKYDLMICRAESDDDKASCYEALGTTREEVESLEAVERSKKLVEQEMARNKRLLDNLKERMNSEFPGTLSSISLSDEFYMVEHALISSSYRLLEGGKCSSDDFKEVEGWMKSSTYITTPTYFTYCNVFISGQRQLNVESKIYLDIELGVLTDYRRRPIFKEDKLKILQVKKVELINKQHQVTISEIERQHSHNLESALRKFKNGILLLSIDISQKYTNQKDASRNFMMEASELYGFGTCDFERYYKYQVGCSKVPIDELMSISSETIRKINEAFDNTESLLKGIRTSSEKQ